MHTIQVILRDCTTQEDHVALPEAGSRDLREMLESKGDYVLQRLAAALSPVVAAEEAEARARAARTLTPAEQGILQRAIRAEGWTVEAITHEGRVMLKIKNPPESATWRADAYRVARAFGLRVLEFLPERSAILSR